MRSIIALIGLVAILSTPVRSFTDWDTAKAADLNFFMVSYTNTGADVPPAGCIPDAVTADFSKVDDACCTGGTVAAPIMDHFANNIARGDTCFVLKTGGEYIRAYLGCSAAGEIEVGMACAFTDIALHLATAGNPADLAAEVALHEEFSNDNDLATCTCLWSVTAAGCWRLPSELDGE